MFNIALSVLPRSEPSEILIKDLSTGDETVSSRTIVITKTDLSTLNGVIGPDDEVVITGFDRDYAVNLKYTVVTNVDTYEMELEFVLLGYSKRARSRRIERFELDTDIVDKNKFKKDTLDINYFMMVARDRVRFGDLVGSQKALDFIADIINLDTVDHNCSCV